MNQIIINTKHNIISQWISKHLSLHFPHMDIISNSQNQMHTPMVDNIYIIEDLYLNTHIENYKNIILLTTDLFYLEKNAIDVSVIYAPIEIEQLISMIKSKIATTSILLEFNEFKFVFSPANNIILHKNNEKIEFTLAESVILHELIKSANHDITKEYLLNHLWNWDLNNSNNTQTIETHIQNIRKKLKNIKCDIKILKNMGGYCLSTISE